MTASAPTYPDWKAPAEDGKLLIWPEVRELSEQTLANHRVLSSAETRVQGLPLRDVRAQMRQWIGHTNDDQPLLGSGHQTELYHPGVWVKDVMSNALAARMNGAAYHFAVDTDAPKHLELRWPGHAEPISDDPNYRDAHWCSRVPAPTPARLEKLQLDLAAANLGYQPLAADFLRELRRLALEEESNLASAITNAAHAIDWQLGLRHHVMLASPLWMSEPYLIFAHHVIAHAQQFAHDYNAALADYRREKKVRTPARPMPDLHAFEDSCELPFWLDELGSGDRTRPTIFRDDRAYVLTLPNAEEFRFDPHAAGAEAASRLRVFLNQNHLRLSPRALTLTTFLRLFVVDQFIHGIGGGQYDQVTDRIIATHFKLTPPTFSVTTATMYLPQAAGRARACMPCLVTEGHRLKHSLLGPRKRELVAAIDAAPRCSQERFLKFADMHHQLTAAATNHPALAKWEQHVRDVRAREAEEASIFDREVFYLMQPRERLAHMISKYNLHFGLT